MTTCIRPNCDRNGNRRGLCHKHYASHKKRQVAYGRWESQFVDTGPVRAHIESLRAAGMGTRAIASAAGVSRQAVTTVLYGKPGRGPGTRILRRNAEAILAVSMPDVLRVSMGRVPALGTRRRLQALIAHGYSQREINRRLGRASDNLAPVIRGECASVLARTAGRVDELFRELEATPGPCGRSRNRGKANRWPLPMDWDEDRIDDPEYQAERSQVRKVRHDPERTAWRKQRVAELTEAGYSLKEIAAQLRCTDRTVLRDRDELGLVGRMAS